MPFGLVTARVGLSSMSRSCSLRQISQASGRIKSSRLRYSWGKGLSIQCLTLNEAPCLSCCSYDYKHSRNFSSQRKSRKGVSSFAKKLEEKENQEKNEPSGGGKAHKLVETMRVHGPAFAVYWTSLWIGGGLGIYAAIEVFGPDVALEGLRYVGADQFINLNSIDPKYYNVGFAIAINEVLEIVRFPFAVATLTTVKKALGMKETVKNEKDGDKEATNAEPKSMMEKLRHRGPVFMLYWTALWISNGVGIYGLIEVFGPEMALQSLNYLGIDQYINLESIDPRFYNIGFAVAINELLEVVRFPFAVATVGSVEKGLGLNK